MINDEIAVLKYCCQYLNTLLLLSFPPSKPLLCSVGFLLSLLQITALFPLLPLLSGQVLLYCFYMSFPLASVCKWNIWTTVRGFSCRYIFSQIDPGVAFPPCTFLLSVIKSPFVTTFHPRGVVCVLMLCLSLINFDFICWEWVENEWCNWKHKNREWNPNTCGIISSWASEILVEKSQYLSVHIAKKKRKRKKNRTKILCSSVCA